MKYDKKDWLIYNLVVQNCSVTDRGYDLDSGFIRPHAEAMDHLDKIGMIELIGGSNSGRGRLANMKKTGGSQKCHNVL